MKGYFLLLTTLIVAAAPTLADTGYGSAYIGAFMQEDAFDNWWEWVDKGIEHPSVRMVEENVDIYLHRAEATVFAEFVFENGGDATTVPMVYPFARDYKGVKCADFEAFVEGENGRWEALPFAVANPDPESDVCDFARFDVPFAAGERKRVKCSYVGFYGWSGEANYITRWGREGYDELWDEEGRYIKEGRGLLPHFCSYILSTGATWRGTIGRGRIAFHPTAELAWEDLIDSDGVAYINGDRERPYQRGNLAREAAFTKFLTRNGVAVTIEDNALVFTFEDLEPAGPNEAGLREFEWEGLPLAIENLYMGDIRASSELPGEGDVDYEPGNVSLYGGGSFGGAWAEGITGDGTGEWIRMRVQREDLMGGLPGPVTLGGVHLYGGYHSAAPRYATDLFEKNGAPQAVTVTAFLAGAVAFRRGYDLAELSAADPSSPNIGSVYLPFGIPVECDEIMITVDAVRPGSQWYDTCISAVVPVAYDDRIHYRASSALVEKPYALCRFHPIKVSDGRADTCWAEGAEGNGVGEWLEIALPDSLTVGGFEIVGGFARDDETWRANGRPAKLRVETFRAYGKAGEVIIPLEDTRESQRFIWDAELGEGLNRVRLTITDVYAGEEYDDVCISEIKLH